jgi:putative flippase GtrA
MMARWLKFNAAGILGVAVQVGTLHLLTRLLSVNYLGATAIAVECAIIHNFIWHERYTWRARTKSAAYSVFKRFAYFNLSNGAVSLLGNLFLMKLLVGMLGIPLIAANLCAIAACSTINFLLAEYFVFAAKSEANDGGLFV